ncbi:MAG: pantoate--beta-alanine ligase [Nitrospirae bacterium CG_4_10_14_0_8_um_filter_41_23]|nr:pantoate--beta-alanine ligase [Nitrospirota bacterium]PIQ94482.1 MAG: pantoate--beta-alanine ligase [Nitrospirae bacterium CG11_big_fil_rev_8_21_14_0_20_41_14]PIV44701.1 MAG: pantoate--beta-alanine ligase [Nitrospirae bacterium CG02_land_8_20_14_3_00_41_53]PIW87762.1 MAG: pantoate--beta-alanine ligase [Nitrospirae bacterium CG_4_8_14_3_um_filter_41_47]PIY86105.1 MAG: pantoate--beta-alanine ligase [Nitrospirae bacterium CG_4_10_14_0_8_um_filter_41_23]PJA80151.1 MAG: pantoate--beta-alanine li
METMRIPRIMQDTSKAHILHGRTIGFVPTMGALHEGHLSLIRMAKQENDITVVSMFVNPIQFGPSEDFKQYPRDIDGDTEKLQREDVDIIFMPEISLMYPEGFLTYVNVEKISDRLCGAFRPGHFKGVATVVTKLLNIVKPAKAYFGQKDFQQAIVIKQLVRDLDMDIDIVICPTVRERDGLAMSSRNAYLSIRQREAATIIYKCLIEALDMIKSGIIDAGYIKRIMQDRLLKEAAVSGLDYAGVYDPVTFAELSEIEGDALLAVAVKLGDTRLIDNMLVTPDRRNG